MSKKPQKRKPGPAPDVYEWKGRTFVGVSAVSAASGNGISTISYHLNRYGNLDRLGVGRQCNFPPDAKSKPVDMFGRRWPSQSAMAREIGIHHSRLCRWLKAGRVDDILRAVMASETARARG